MSDMPDEKFEADKSCTLCHGHGLYVVGSSGSADDGDAPIYEGCDCVVKYISAEKAKADKLALLEQIGEEILEAYPEFNAISNECLLIVSGIKQRIEGE